MQGLITSKKLLITSKNYNQAIEIKGASVLTNQEARVSQITENEEQLFILYKVEDDFELNKNYYYIANIHSELLLTVQGNKVVQQNYQNINEQKFAFIELPNGCYIIQQKDTDKVFEVVQGQDSNNMLLSINHFSYGYNNQLFTLKESFVMFEQQQQRFIVNDICQSSQYQLVPNIPINIKCAHSNLFLDVFEHSTSKNAILVQWSQNYKNNQKFILERVEIEQPISSLINNHTQTIQTHNQIQSNSNICNTQSRSSIVIHEPKCLENVYYVRCVESSLYWTIQDARLSDGGKLVQDHLQEYSKNHHQRFLFQILVNGNVHIKPYHSKKYLDVEANSYHCGANIIQFHKNCQLNQQFNIVYN